MPKLGLIVQEIEKQHQEFVNSLGKLPVAFGDADKNNLPKSTDTDTEVYDQLSTNSCAGNELAGLFTEQQRVQTGEPIRYSPWFAYLTAQMEGGFFGKDQGTSISSTIDAANKYGCCLEELCPNQGWYNTKISKQAYEDAANHKHIGTLIDLRDWDEMISWITDMRGVAIGTKWFSSQDNMRSDTWIETLTRASNGSFRGYHARYLFYWETLDGILCPRCRNSHGKGWARNGRSVITRETWEWWRRDPNFAAYGFSKINERIPKRQDLRKFSFVLGDKPSIG